MGDHSHGVTRNYLAVDASLEEGYWDDVFREKSYYEEQDGPVEVPSRGEKGREVGEFDVLAVNYDDQRMLYVEVKTSFEDLTYARDQLDRADRHFDDWEVIGQTWLED